MHKGINTRIANESGNNFKGVCTGFYEVNTADYKGNPTIELNRHRINGTKPMTFGLTKARVYMENIELIKQVSQSMDPERVAEMDSKIGKMQLTYQQCGIVEYYENNIRLFISQPDFAQSRKL